MRKAAKAAKVREYKLLISLKAANTAKIPLGDVHGAKGGSKAHLAAAAKRRDASVSAALLYAPRDDNNTTMMFVRFRTTARRNSRMPLIGRSSRRLSRGVAC